MTLQSRIQENYTNGDAVLLLLYKQSGANTVAIADAAYRTCWIQKNLPPDIKIETVMDTSDHIKVSINNLLETIFLALIIVGVVVLLLRRWHCHNHHGVYSDFWFVHLSLSNRNTIMCRSRHSQPSVWWWMMPLWYLRISLRILSGSRPKQAAVYGTEEVSLR